MEAIKESFEHAGRAKSLIDEAVEHGDATDGEAAFIEANLAIAKAIAGLALAVLEHIYTNQCAKH